MKRRLHIARPGPGKRRETRPRIANAGMRVFLANGFEATMLDMIAAAADVSRHTFFSSFDSKDAVLESWKAAWRTPSAPPLPNPPPLDSGVDTSERKTGAKPPAYLRAL